MSLRSRITINSLFHPEEKYVNLFQGEDKQNGLWRTRGTMVGRIMHCSPKMTTS